MTQQNQSLIDLANDCIKINMEIISNSTRALTRPNLSESQMRYFKHAIEYSKADLKNMNELKKRWQ